MARAIPVLPLVASIRVSPGWISPRSSARRIMDRAGLSFTEPAGLLPSSLARTVLSVCARQALEANQRGVADEVLDGGVSHAARSQGGSCRDCAPAPARDKGLNLCSACPWRPEYQLRQCHRRLQLSGPPASPGPCTPGAHSLILSCRFARPIPAARPRLPGGTDSSTPRSQGSAGARLVRCATREDRTCIHRCRQTPHRTYRDFPPGTRLRPWPPWTATGGSPVRSSQR